MEKWSKHLNIPLPECNRCGCCCICASPSTPYITLLEKAAKGEDFARDFFSVFVPYKSVEEAKKTFPDVVERTLNVAEKAQSEEPVFYKCRYHSEQAGCLVYEDRPQLCRDFPGSPYVILSERCTFYNWAKECKEKYKELKEHLEELKRYKKELENYKYQQKALYLNQKIKTVPEEYKFMWLCSSMCLISPGNSWIKIH